MKYNVSYINDPASNRTIEADEVNLDTNTRAVSFYQKEPGSLFRTVAILALTKDMSVVEVKPVEELPVAA